MKRKEYPDWVKRALPEGCVVRERSGKYYVYKRTSHRFKGMRYPISTDVYCGVISKENGYMPKGKILVGYSDVDVYEFGMSYAILNRCPDSWKRAIGQTSDVMLYAIIRDMHSDTYLVLPEFGQSEKYESRIRNDTIVTKIKAQRANLYRRFRETYGVSKEELDLLRNVRLVLIGKHRILSRICEDQQKVLDKLQLTFELEVR